MQVLLFLRLQLRLLRIKYQGPERIDVHNQCQIKNKRLKYIDILDPFQGPLPPPQDTYFCPETLLRIQFNALNEHLPLVNKTPVSSFLYWKMGSFTSQSPSGCDGIDGEALVELEGVRMVGKLLLILIHLVNIYTRHSRLLMCYDFMTVKIQVNNTL